LGLKIINFFDADLDLGWKKSDSVSGINSPAPQTDGDTRIEYKICMKCVGIIFPQGLYIYFAKCD
jgi:hypothetical protein